jgi:hypothetical protein
MKSLALRAVALALISCLILVCAPQAAQANTTPAPVRVVNTTKNPVPTVAQGITKISGNVNVTNNPLPVMGSVSITNTSVPVNVTNSPLGVSGTVDVSNLPLDANGNVRTSVAPDTTQYQFLSITAMQVSGRVCINSYGADFCTYNGTQYVPIEQTLATLSAQGYELVSVVSAGLFGGVQTENQMVYTLKLPLTGPHSKRSSLPGQR